MANQHDALEREQRERDASNHKKLDASWGIFQEKIENVLLEMNIRYTQYVSQFKIYSTEYKIHQVLSDFNRNISVMQKRTKKNSINFDLPVARLNNGKYLYANRSSNLGIFSMEKEK